MTPCLLELLEIICWHQGLSSGPEYGPQNSCKEHGIVLLNDWEIQWRGFLLFLSFLCPVLKLSITDYKSQLKSHSDFSSLGFSFERLPKCNSGSGKFCITKVSMFTPFESLQLIFRSPVITKFWCCFLLLHMANFYVPPRCLILDIQIFCVLNWLFLVSNRTSAFQVSSDYQLLPQQWGQMGILKQIVLLHHA